MMEHSAGQLRDLIARADAPTIGDIIAALDEIECWRPIEGFPGYKISSWGRISGKRVDTLIYGEAHGYKTVSLSNKTIKKTFRVSLLVLRAFVGPPPFSGAHGAHNDGDKNNNRLSNLRWATTTDNQADVDRHGNRVRGSSVFGAKLTEDDIPKIRERIASGERFPRIAEDFDVSISTISLIKRGRIWTHV